MKIKRFFTKDMRTAIREVGSELGPEAVIISNTKVEGGVEVIAAIDYDETFFRKEVKSVKNTTNTIASKEESTSDPLPAAKSKVTIDSHTKDFLSHIQDMKQDVPIRGSVEQPSLDKIHEDLSDLRFILEQQMSDLILGSHNKVSVRSKLVRNLLKLGFNGDVCAQIMKKIPENLNAKQAWFHTLKILKQLINVKEDENYLSRGIISLMGPTGVGKTTTIAKLAARSALKYGRQNIALITTDCYRIGSHEQIRIYGRILNIPVYSINNKNELSETIKNLCDKDVILIDNAGMSQRDKRFQNQTQMICETIPDLKIILTLAANVQQSSMEEVVSAFSGKEIDSCIITKIDEANNLGAVLSTSIKHNIKIRCISDGQRVPEDLYIARAGDLLSRTMELTKLHGHDSENELLALGQHIRGTSVNANL